MSPSDTVARIARFKGPMGITRVADITGLDHIGIPVVVVCRPNSRSLAVSQGKGVDIAAAKASGLMESVEAYHAERVTLPLVWANYEEIRYTRRVVDVALLPKSPSCRFTPYRSILWIEADDLLSGEIVWLPYECVHLNYTLPLPAGSGCFAPTSNGLASGNHLLEAISTGICEVIERDATALWSLAGSSRPDTRIDVATIDDEACRELLDRFERAGVAVGVWETTSNILIPSFLCVIADREADPLHALPYARGMGCHPSRAIALSRALTEAAQARLTYIAGSRDDLYRTYYHAGRALDIVARTELLEGRAAPAKSYRDVPTHETDAFEDDVSWELERLDAAGFDRVLAVDLTKPEFGLAVVRIVVPGLENLTLRDAEPGARAKGRITGGGMTVYVFVGPTLSVEEARQELDAVYLPPVSQGDVCRIALRRPRAIGIIDGAFERTAAVWHKEILWALSHSIPVYGSASMGALRAAELAPFGMEGVGAIFADYVEGRRENDDAVAVTHGPAELGFRATSEALVNIEATLRAAEQAGVLTPPSRRTLERAASELFYPERSYPRLLASASANGVPQSELGALHNWLPGGRVDQKREDALEMLRVIRSRLEGRLEPDVARFTFEYTHFWDQARRLAGKLDVDGDRETEPVRVELLLDELRLGGSYEHVMRDTLLRALAFERAERDGIPVRKEPDGRMSYDEVLRALEVHLRSDVFAALPETLSESRDHPAIIGRARMKQRLLEEHGLDHVSPASVNLTAEAVVDWYFQQTRGEPVPADLAQYARRVGFADTLMFERAVFREYLYSTLLPDGGADQGRE